MANFEAAFDEVIGLEGGYVNDPNDKGGETNWGIAKRWHPNVDVKHLSKEGAKQIYWNEYWNPLQLAVVLNDDIAAEIFEQAVNMGRKQAAYHVQWSLGLLGEPVNVDGFLGQATSAAINKLGQARSLAFLKCANGFQFMKYLEIVTADPSQKKFFVGWLKRVAIHG